MTDERDLHELAAPLLADPPHPPPPIHELERRVGRRRQRRARAIGLCSVVAVVLVAAGVLALPRDAELRAGDGSTPTTQPPPPLANSAVRLTVTPESAPLEVERTIEIRNNGAEVYSNCGFTYDLYRWDGAAWAPVATVYLGGIGTTFFEYEAKPGVADCSPSFIGRGDARTRGFAPGSASWHPPGGSIPPEIAALVDGWYELRDPYGEGKASFDALGRFEIGPGTLTPSDPPPIGDAPVDLEVDPATAPVDADRTLTIRNTSGIEYAECGWIYGLHRWTGTRWLPVARLSLTPDGPHLREDPETPTIFDCATRDAIAPGDSRTFPFNLATTRWNAPDATTPPRTDLLEPGVYELRPHKGSGEPLPALGRFEITDLEPPGPNTPVQPPDLPPPPPSDLVPSSRTGRVVLDVWPVDGLEPKGEVLPDQMLVVDDATVALTWTGSCNRPADSVQVTATEAEVEVRLRIGVFLTTDCMGEPDRWALVVDLPFSLEGRPLVARAGPTESLTIQPPTPRPPAARMDDAAVIDPQPISFLISPAGSPTGAVRLGVPWPVATPDRACGLQVIEVDGIAVPLVVNGRSAAASPADTCSELGFDPLGRQVFGVS